MFKKLINDSRSEEWNIIMYTLLLALIFFIVFTPIIILGVSMHPELSETLTAAPETEIDKARETISSTASIFEFIISGTILEYLRRKKSMKFKITDPQATKLLFYFCVEMTVYVTLIIIGGLI